MDLDLNRPESVNRIGTELVTTTNALVLRLHGTTITTAAEAEQARFDRKAIGDAIKQVETFFEPFVKLAFQLHKTLCDRRREILTPLQQLDLAKSRGLTEFKAREDRIRQDQERAEAERRRRDDEARATAEAAALERQGEHAMAALVLEDAITAPEPVVTLPDVTSEIPYRRMWRWKFVNDDEAAAVAHLIPREFLCADVQKIGSHVRAHKSTTKIPGIQIYHEDIPVR